MGTVRLSAVTLHVTDMSASVEFYAVLAGTIVFGGSDSAFTSIRLGGDDIHDGSFLNLALRREGTDPVGPAAPTDRVGWGRWIVHVDDPDEIHARFADRGFVSETAPSDAPWGERYFHIRDPDGHELSVARPIDPG